MNDKTTDWQLRYQDKDYLSLSIKRLGKEPLLWCKQFSNLINDNASDCKELIINDIGCNVGHFARVIDDLKADIKYRGYDISETYLKVAKDKFQMHEFYKLDIENDIPDFCDVTVISATLEHVNNFQSALENILNSTNLFVLLRSFFGEEFRVDPYKKNTANESYQIAQYQFSQISELASDNGFSARYLRDYATDSIPQYLGCGISRTQYVALLSKF